MASGTRVAIKYLSPRLFGDPQFLAAFRSEAALLRSLNVPSVVRLFDYAEAPGQGAAIIMELVDGVSLHEMITRQGPGSPESALLVLKGSLQGLAAAHALGIVHRDYKPENVLVDGTGQSKLTDFGVAVRAGQDAAAGGTPLYMAPEQWDGGPATPATDIYAATAVFFECLTGQTPFSGPLGQLAAQHAAAAVPVERVDEPLRALVARGMAKDPAGRPADATAFMSDLEATAAAAYGPDWESRGRGHLAERAAALLLLLLPHGGAAVGAGTGTTTASTWLPAATTTARAGLHGWKLAALYSGLFVGVFAAVAGTLVGISAARGGSSSSHAAASGSGGSPSPSAPAPSTVAASPACGNSGRPALAYATEVGSAFTLTTVLVRCGTGAPHTLATLHSDTVESLAWSADGTQLAWTTGTSGLTVAQAKAGNWTTRHWTCQCTGLAFLGGQAVSGNAQTAGGPQSLHAAVPELLVFPQSGTAPPATLSLTGIAASSLGTEFRLLGSVSPTELLVDYGDGGGSNLGGFQQLYHVNAAGQATQYGHATIAATKPTASSVFGSVTGVTVSASGTQVAFHTYSRGGACGGSDTAQLLDTATGAVTTPGTPAGGGPEGYWVEGMWFDQAGTPYAALVPNLSTCSTTGTQPSGGLEPNGATPTVVKLSGGQWVKAGSGVRQAAYGPGRWLAEHAGPVIVANSPGTPLTISGPGTAAVTVPNVAAFAWAP